MALKSALPVLLGLALITRVAQAADYDPDQYLSLDLSKAVLSPKRLGPPQQFEPAPVQAKTNPSGVFAQSNPRKIEVQRIESAPVRSEMKSAADRSSEITEVRKGVRNERRRVAARVHLARPHSIAAHRSAARGRASAGAASDKLAVKARMNAGALDTRIPQVRASQHRP